MHGDVKTANHIAWVTDSLWLVWSHAKATLFTGLSGIELNMFCVLQKSSLGKNGFLMRKLITLPYSDILLRRSDLLPEHFVPEIKVTIEFDGNNIFPLPLVVDTGAPSTLFLGYRLREVLEKVGVLKEVTLLNAPSQLVGSSLWKGNRIQNPFVHYMPDKHELPAFFSSWPLLFYRAPRSNYHIQTVLY